MEISTFRRSAELMGMDDHDPLFFHQFPMNQTFNEHDCMSLDSAFWEDVLYQSYSQPKELDFKRPIESTRLEPNNRPLKQPKQQIGWNPISFSNQMGIVKPEEEWSPSSTMNFPYEFSFGSYMKSKSSTSPRVEQSREHVLAERKRREKLAQKFVSLSVLVPGLKKMDKASILGEAIKYMKELQGKVNNLEEQNKKKGANMESVVFVKKHEIHSSSSDESVSNGPIKLPEIDAKFCNNEVLISIHCEKRKGMLEKIVAEIENLNLLVVNSSIMSFGDSVLNITVIAKKDEEFALSMKEVVKRLRIALD